VVAHAQLQGPRPRLRASASTARPGPR
jgi:hypothetical protein